jgi:hypothetical protein
MPDSNDLKSLDSQLKKTLLSAESFKKGSSVNFSKNIINIQKTNVSLIGNVRQLVASVASIEKIVNNNSRKITSLKNISKTQSSRISGENIGAKLPGSSASKVEDSITKISVSVASIAAILAGRKKVLDNTAAFDRRKAEQEKRGLAEANLEKRFDGLKSAAEKIIAPVKSVLDKIIDFFVTVFLGRVVYKLLEWFGDKKNADKVKSIGRFLKDFGPAILTAFILFGTSFGRLTLGLTKMIGGFVFKIGKVLIPQLLKLIARNPKAALAAGLFTAGATIPAMFPGTVDEQEKKTKSKPGSTEDKIKALEQQKANLNPFQKMQGVGSEIDEQLSTLKTGQTKSYGFSGGGFNSKGMLGGGGLGAMLGPLGMLLGGALGSGKPQEMFGGFVSGEKGVDKVPAMLTDGEFVMSAGAVQKYGVDTLEGMNAAGGGTNKPKMIGGTTYAAGGGFIGDARKSLIDINNWFSSQGINLQDPKSWSGTGGRFAINLANQAQGLGQGLANQGQGLAKQAINYFTGNNLEKNITKLTQAGTQFGAGLYDQASKIGNRTLSDLQSGELQKKATELPKKAAGGLFDAVKNMSSSETYKKYSDFKTKTANNRLEMTDKFIKKLPEGPFKEIADKGLIPIPTGDAVGMRNWTFIKAMLGPLGSPFKIMSNKEVDAMRQQTIEKTMSKSGLNVDPKTGQVSMNWNQEDINKGARGGGAYTDKFGTGYGAGFNSTLGRFSAKTEGGGNTLYTDDRYNFNKTVGEYAELAKQGLMKGSISDAGYFGASMLGRFAQDIGWLNERALGSKIEIGQVNKSTLDPKTGRKKSAAQIAADQTKMKQAAASLAAKRANEEKNKKALEAKRPWWDKMGMFGGASKQIQEKAKLGTKPPAKPPVKPSVKPKPRVVYGPPAPKKRNVRGGGSSTKTPSFSVSNPNGHRSKQETLGLMR